MKKFKYMLILILILSVSLAGCAPKSGSTDNARLEEELKTKEEEINELKEKIKELESTNTLPTSVLSAGLSVMEALKDKDMTVLSQFVHPNKGLRFTPYSYTDIQQDLVFTSQEVQGLMQDTQVKHWGLYDGSGEPIDLKFSDYYDKFVYDKDFLNPHIIGNSTIISQGNMINNLAQAYPNSPFLEFHFNGFDAQYDGIDWESLTLVFEELNGVYYLVGIVHGQWTI